jgi:hypothetical protein
MLVSAHIKIIRLYKLLTLSFEWLDRMRFEVLTATSMKKVVFWDVAPCSLVDIDRHFKGVHCLRYADVGGSKLL